MCFYYSPYMFLKQKKELIKYLTWGNYIVDIGQTLI